jgi:NADPH2:quinone reductase
MLLDIRIEGIRTMRLSNAIFGPTLAAEGGPNMRAQVLSSYDGFEAMSLAEIAKPMVQSGHVLVKIRAAALNQIDIKISGGLPIGPELPAILGADFAGVVEAVGEGVLDFRPGDEVYGCAGGVRGQGGTLAEFILADARLIAPKPKSLSFREAAALPLVSITAWDGLERANLSKSDHVLIHGGTGGVGHVAIQLAKVAGARVATTVSSDEAGALARGLGADETVNFKSENVAGYVSRLTAGRGFDLVFDTVGGTNLPSSFEAAAVGARVSTTNSRVSVDLGPMHGKALSLHVVFMLLPMLLGPGRDRHGKILREIAWLADAGRLRPLLDQSRFDLTSAVDAYRHLASGKARGKVVLDIA